MEEIMSNNLQRFKFEKRNDFKIYLHEIIVNIYGDLKIYRRYLKELEEYIKTKKIYENPKKLIRYDVYIDFKNKIIFTQNQLANIIGDDSDKALSYKKFRRIAEKHSKKFDLNFETLDYKIRNKLNDINELRNWSLHKPESLLTSQLEIRSILKDNYENEFGIRTDEIYDHRVRVVEFEFCEGEWLISLLNECNDLEDEFSKIFTQVKKDYSKLAEESMRIEKTFIKVRPIEDSVVSLLSHCIQNKYYKKQNT